MEKEITFTFDFCILTIEQYNIDILTKVLNIEPTNKWYKGDIIKDNRMRKESCWSIISEEIESLTFENIFIDFIDKILLKQQELNDLSKKEGLKIQINTIIKIYGGNTMPGIHLSNNIIEILAKLRCSIDFDIYDFR